MTAFTASSHVGAADAAYIRRSVREPPPLPAPPSRQEADLLFSSLLSEGAESYGDLYCEAATSLAAHGQPERAIKYLEAALVRRYFCCISTTLSSVKTTAVCRFHEASASLPSTLKCTKACKYLEAALVRQRAGLSCNCFLGGRPHSNGGTWRRRWCGSAALSLPSALFRCCSSVLQLTGSQGRSDAVLVQYSSLRRTPVYNPSMRSPLLPSPLLPQAAAEYDTPVVWAQLAACYSAAGRPEDAAALYREKVGSMDPGEPHFLTAALQLVDLHVAAGDRWGTSGIIRMVRLLVLRCGGGRQASLTLCAAMQFCWLGWLRLRRRAVS